MNLRYSINESSINFARFFKKAFKIYRWALVGVAGVGTVWGANIEAARQTFFLNDKDLQDPVLAQCSSTVT